MQKLKNYNLKRRNNKLGRNESNVGKSQTIHKPIIKGPILFENLAKYPVEEYLGKKNEHILNNSFSQNTSKTRQSDQSLV